MKLPPLTLGVVRDIRDQTGVDILRVGELAVSRRLQTDMVWIGRAIAIAGGPTDLSGDTIGEAASAFFDRVVEFFPKASVLDESGDGGEGPKNNPWHAVFKMAGVAGLDPYPLSLRELWWAAEGAWEPHAVAISNFHAANCAKGQRPPKPADVNPYARNGRTITRRMKKSQTALSK